MANLLTDNEMASLVEAIRYAEDQSTGEIRIHIDTSENENNAAVALNVFRALNMQHTKERNAVLFHVNFSQRYLTIIGDEGIHAKVSQKFWDDMHDRVTTDFAAGHYFEGLKNAVTDTGVELKKHFPLQGGHINELPNDITFS